MVDGPGLDMGSYELLNGYKKWKKKKWNMKKLPKIIKNLDYDFDLTNLQGLIVNWVKIWGPINTLREPEYYTDLNQYLSAFINNKIKNNRIKGLNEKGIRDLIKNKIKITDYAVTDELLQRLLKYPIVLEHKDSLFNKEALDKYEHCFIEAALEAA